MNDTLTVQKHAIDGLSDIEAQALLKLTGWQDNDLEEMTEEGWTPQHLMAAWAARKTTPDNIRNMGTWSKRYIQEGHLWGEEPSETAELVITEHGGESNVRILEFGGGYGRDAQAFCEMGFMYTGVEQSQVGFNMCDDRINEYIQSDNASMQHCSIRAAQLAKNFDIAVSHRTMHLINPSHHRSVVTKLYNSVTTGSGMLVISARDPDDFNPEQMDLLDQNGNVIENPSSVEAEEIKTARYKNRKGHLVNFFGKKRFFETFGTHFTMEGFYQGKEIESIGNNNKDGSPVMSSFTVAVMKSRPEPIRLNGQTLVNGNVIDTSDIEALLEALPETQKLPSQIEFDEKRKSRPLPRTFEFQDGPGHPG